MSLPASAPGEGTAPYIALEEIEAKLRSVGTAISQHKGVSVAVALVWIGWAAFQFRRRNQLALHNCSINILRRVGDGADSPRWELTFRTIYEKPIASILENQYASSLVLRQARRCGDSPIVFFSNKSDRTSVLKSFSNQVSSCYCVGYLHEAMGLPVHKEDFVMALTCESQAFFLKTRTMLIRKDQLEEIARDPDAFNTETVSLPEKSRKTRVHTVQALARAWAHNKSDFAVVSLSVPKSTMTVFERPKE